MGCFLLCGKVNSLSHPHFLARDPVSFHRQSVARDATLHQRALVTNSSLAIVGSCLTTSSAVWLLMVEWPPEGGWVFHTAHLASFYPSVPLGKLFQITITAWILEPHRPGEQRQRWNVQQCESTRFLVNIWTHGEEGPANSKLFSERQHTGPNLSLPSLLTPEPPRARNRRL